MPAEKHAPETFDELAALLRARLPGLTRSQRLLAERVLADPEGVAFMTVTELAAAIGVNESTVVRFATGLDLDGFPGLVRLCRERLREQAQLLRRFANLESFAAQARHPIELAAAFDQANITRSMARVDRPAWQATVTALAEAPRVHVMGLRKCYSVAHLLGYLLGLVREDVSVLDGAHGTLTDQLRRVREGDCFVGISIHRYSADTVRAFEWASGRGATAVALTDNPASPLVRTAEHAFYLDTTGVSVLRSMTAFVALVQAMATAVAAERGTEARSALLVEEELLDSFEVYTPGSDDR
ncbi:MurR/RpiR family transcriptional regulator [Saccharopolyspora oryzae]|uniref:MurR/RpiR family transcriptional regulator n=1 Tax=Saccharopolyspora oryzae TaxID=2997343 RepID=A0ABT4USI7_9PSEU|nr:MurR/RpiR family transcriptional regulator [Saccharopolyspora oryzae]MDA3624680.1 MurR/RpiR family transcriptional regulator [Saccharopolyspora oryzae]